MNTSVANTIVAKQLLPTKTPRRRTPQWALSEHSKASAPDHQEDRYHSRTIERALDALDAFGFSNAPRSLKEISAITSQPESSLYRVLTTLQKRNYLLQNRDGTYQLTRKVLYGRTLDMAEVLREFARPVLEDLGRSFDETVALSYLFTDYIQVLDTVETFHPIRVTNRIGRIIPPHCSSMGKAILAYQDNETADRMLETYGLNPRTVNSITDRGTLRRELENVRAQGFAVDREESMLGGVCYGAPIVSSGNVIGALSVSTPIPRLDPAREDSIRLGVMEAARRVGDILDAKFGKLQ
jgi:IclR family acetate operon transcriptional repressor